jgi:hypothetical protein
MTVPAGGARRRSSGQEPESVVSYFNRGRQVAGDLLRENERLRSRIRHLEGELRRAAAKVARDGGQGAE